MTATSVHVAGLDVAWSDRYLRQRCAWCGVTLLDYDLATVVAPLREDGTPPPPPATWPIGALVEVTGTPGAGSQRVVEAVDGKVPPGSCLDLDPAVTA